MSISKSPDAFMPTALLALTKLTGEFTIREMAEKLMAMGVPEPTVTKPLRVWGNLAQQGVKRGLLVKTHRNVLVHTQRMGGSTERVYYYARTERTDVVLPPRRLAEAEKFLAEHQPQAQP